MKVRKVDQQVMDDILQGIFDLIDAGESVMITKVEDGKWTIGPANKKALQVTSGKLSGKAYWDEVCTPEYREWEKEWITLSAAEKAKRCKTAGVTWTHAPDPRVDAINMTEAYRNKLGITKYKPQYESRKAREAIRA